MLLVIIVIIGMLGAVSDEILKKKILRVQSDCADLPEPPVPFDNFFSSSHGDSNLIAYLWLFI